MSQTRKAVLLLFTLAFVALYIALMLWGWGDWRTFWAHPARTGLVVLLVGGAAAAIFVRTSGFSGGKREDVKQRWFILAMLPLMLSCLYLTAYTDRRDLWVIDGDAVRYTGLLLLFVGFVVRGIAVFTLGYRFSGAVAIQEGHTLVTEGIFRRVRHPSYLGALIAMTGWMLVFRSLIGLLFVFLFVPLLIWRMNAEERLLISEFGEEYAAYKGRTWRLVPYVY